ncbi:general transcription factor 3C polypeptide 5-like [Styela clava]
MEKDSVCDVIPKFNQEKPLVWIEYPGIVKDADKMLKTLGGQKNISGTYREENKRIDLRFRPDDPCCHAVCGDRKEVNALLLNVKKYRRKKSPNNNSSADEFRYRPELVGVVETAYKFNALCDFQYLPLHNDVENDKLVNMIPHLKVNNLDDAAYTNEVPLFLPPATFSRFDQQLDVLFRSVPKYNQSHGNPNKIGITRPRRIHFAQYLKYEENWTPKEPLPAAQEVLEKIKKTEEGLVQGIKDLFEKRPIWSKNAIRCILQCSGERLKFLLPALAYYFITGPWRSLWVKFGYDPRKDPGAAEYQLLDFRVRQGLNTPHIPIKAKRSTLSYRLPNLMPRSKLESNIVNNLDEKSTASSSYSKEQTEAMYIFKSGVLPAYRQTFYQVCDILHPSVKDIVQSQTGLSNKCDMKSGWYPKGMAAKIRDILSQDIQNTISNTEGMEQPIINMERATRKKYKSRVSKSTENFEEPSFQDLLLDLSSDEEKQSLNEEVGDSGSEQEEILSDNDAEVMDDVELNEEEDENLEVDNTLKDSNNFVDLSQPYFNEELTDFLDDFEAFSPDDFDDNIEDN